VLVVVRAPGPSVAMTEDAEQQSGDAEDVRQGTENVRAMLLEQEEASDQNERAENEETGCT
jgi:hypothetical protein